MLLIYFTVTALHSACVQFSPHSPLSKETARNCCSLCENGGAVVVTSHLRSADKSSPTSDILLLSFLYNLGYWRSLLPSSTVLILSRVSASAVVLQFA